MTTAIQIPARREIKYPDSDGRPMADNTLQFRWIVTIKEGVDALFHEDPSVFVAGDLLWYAVEGNNKIRIAPDVLVAFGRPKGDRGSYKQWAEGGIAPQVVFEILSPGNRKAELKRKFEFYQRYGVEEYYIYDPDNGDLKGWRRQGGELKAIRRMKGFVSPRLRIRFEPGKGSDNLTITGPNGKPFRTVQEIIAQSEVADQRAEDAIRRAEDAARRAEDATGRAERLAAKLRALGIEPD
jgi:Uma2 family endonuclease